MFEVFNISPSSIAKTLIKEARDKLKINKMIAAQSNRARPKMPPGMSEAVSLNIALTAIPLSIP